MLVADLALAQRLESYAALSTAEYATTLKRLQPESRAQVLPVAGGYATFTTAEYPINRAIGLGMTTPIAAADLEAVEDFYRGFGVPALVDVCPLADSSLVAALGEHGYRIVRFFNVLTRPITADDAGLAPPSEIRVTQAADADLWALTAARGFHDSDDIAADGMSLARLAFNNQGVSCFLAWIGDEPVGAAALGLRDGLASLFSTSTRAAYRRRGVQMALIRARLAAAAAAGCDLAMVMSLPGNHSQRNVQRAGFQVAYTRLVMQRALT